MTQGPNSPATAVDDSSVGTISWANPTYAEASDTNYAIAQDSSGNASTSHYLKVSNFGFSIPSATINGILVEIERYRTFNIGTHGAVTDNIVKLIKSNGTLGTNNNASATSWSNTESYFSYGNSSDLWGDSWLASDINSSNFGVVLSVNGGASIDRWVANVNHIRITVYYTASGGRTLASGRTLAMRTLSSGRSLASGRSLV